MHGHPGYRALDPKLPCLPPAGPVNTSSPLTHKCQATTNIPPDTVRSTAYVSSQSRVPSGVWRNQAKRSLWKMKMKMEKTLVIRRLPFSPKPIFCPLFSDADALVQQITSPFTSQSHLGPVKEGRGAGRQKEREGAGSSHPQALASGTGPIMALHSYPRSLAPSTSFPHTPEAASSYTWHEQQLALPPPQRPGYAKEPKTPPPPEAESHALLGSPCPPSPSRYLA